MEKLHNFIICFIMMCVHLSTGTYPQTYYIIILYYTNIGCSLRSIKNIFYVNQQIKNFPSDFKMSSRPEVVVELYSLYSGNPEIWILINKIWPWYSWKEIRVLPCIFLCKCWISRHANQEINLYPVCMMRVVYPDA